jgi:hypothetical protein
MIGSTIRNTFPFFHAGTIQRPRKQCPGNRLSSSSLRTTATDLRNAQVQALLFGHHRLNMSEGIALFLMLWSSLVTAAKHLKQCHSNKRNLFGGKTSVGLHRVLDWLPW